ncbi:putative ribonuclease H-like domain-containing protein [Tanacetum coccineum]
MSLTQEEGIDYDEVFAPVARIEAIRLFLAFASYKEFLVYQMDAKSAFLYSITEEEVYVHQPLGFVDPAHPNKVYKVVKALYGLHQAPRAWYETLSSLLLEKELKDTKQTLGNVVLKLGEESEDQGRKFQDIDDDPLVSLVRESMKEKSTDFVTPTKASGEAHEEEISPTILEAAKTLSKVASQGVSKEKSTDKGKRYRRRARSMAKKIDTGLDAEEEINTGREEINTGIEEVSTGSTKVDSGTASKRGQREGKAPMIEEDIQATHKTKEQLRQEEAGLEEAIKLQAQLDEEVAKQIHLDKMIAKRMAEEEALTEQQKKRKAQVQFEAQFYTEEDWDTIRAKLEANAELSKDVLGQDLPEQDFAKRMVDMVNQRKKHFAEERAKAKRNKPMTQSQLRIYMSNYLKNQGTWKLSQLKKLKFEEIKEEFDNAQEDSETDKEESIEVMNPTPLTTKSDSVANWKIFQQGEFPSSVGENRGVKGCTIIAIIYDFGVTAGENISDPKHVVTKPTRVVSTPLIIILAATVDTMVDTVVAEVGTADNTGHTVVEHT